MAKIIFFEKTGCKNNTKQKQILEYNGHDVEAIDIINYAWTENELLDFFKDIDPKDWFNLNAPAITNGSVNPTNFDKESALEALLNEHILIKRPLMIISETKLVGFNIDEINGIASINKNAHPSIPSMLDDISKGCPNKNNPGIKCP
jgi:nitrogenase-associated protein